MIPEITLSPEAMTPEEFRRIAEGIQDRLIPPKYGRLFGVDPMLSTGYFDCVGLVLIGRKNSALSHYPTIGTMYQLELLEEIPDSIPDPEGMIPVRKRDPMMAVVKQPEEYIQSMIKWTTGYHTQVEREKDLVAIPFGGEKGHIGLVVDALNARGMPVVEHGTCGHFSDAELGGGQGQLIVIPEERRVLYHTVYDKKVLEIRVNHKE
jgi:hypothetical protein